MFVFNPELILHNINSWSHALLIFTMAMIGMSAFECAAQGWCLTKNKLYEIPFFLAAAFILFHPGAVASLLNFSPDVKYAFFPLGILLYGLVIFLQRKRVTDSVSSKRALP
jgi:TRAP-type uncharacterized transport system fused permease subunit